MFLTKLLVGNEIFMDHLCRDLTVPPTDAKTNMKYNTVSGETGGSKVWVVYENGRAYPEYLVRYYRGPQDAKRTPFVCRDDAVKASKPTQQVPGEQAVSDNQRNVPTWEYLDNTGWRPYCTDHQSLLEARYQAFQSFQTRSSTWSSLTPSARSSQSIAKAKVQLETDEWRYEVDVNKMIQTNLQHAGKKQRDVRRTKSFVSTPPTAALCV